MKNLLVACASLALVAGCSKKDDTKADPKATSEPKTAGEAKAVEPKAAAAPTGCPDGALKDTDNGYCIKMPAAWKLIEGTKIGADDKKSFGPDKYDYRLTILTHPTNDSSFEDLRNSEKAMAAPSDPKEKTIGSGDLPNGGYFYAKSFGNGISQGGTVVKGPKGSIECMINQSDENFNEALEACKSLTSL